MKKKRLNKKVLITRIFCAFLAFMMVIGIVYSAIAYL